MQTVIGATFEFRTDHVCLTLGLRSQTLTQKMGEILTESDQTLSHFCVRVWLHETSLTGRITLHYSLPAGKVNCFSRIHT